MINLNKYYIFIALIIFFNLQGFYLLDETVFHTSDVAFILEIVFIIFASLKGAYKQKSRYLVIMLLPVVLIFTSSYSAYMHYGQPLWYGIRAQRAWVSAMLMYFPLSGLLRGKRISIAGIITVLDRMIFTYMVLLVVQFFVGSSVTFMHLQTSSRFGSVRLYASTYFIVLVYFIHLQRLIERKKIQIFDIFILGCTFFIHLFVVKSRMGFMALILATAFAILSARFTGRKLALICVGLLGTVAFMSSSYGQMVVDAMFGSTAQDAGTEIRDVGRVFYIEQTLSTKMYALLGSGYANLDWQPTMMATRYLEGIYYNDNGIIGLFFYYGFAMVGWILIAHIKVMKDAWQSRARGIFMFLLCGLIGAYTLFPYSYVTDISFAIALAIVEEQVSNKDRLNVI